MIMSEERRAIGPLFRGMDLIATILGSLGDYRGKEEPDEYVTDQNCTAVWLEAGVAF